MTVYCNKCRKQVNFTVKVVEPHVGAYCTECNNWVKWLNGSECKDVLKQLFSDNTQYSPPGAGKPAVMDITIDCSDIPWD